jgi:glutathione peroxidase
MVNTFLQHRNTHGPAANKISTFRKFMYAAFAVFLIFMIYSTKFLFEERYTARQNLVFEDTGSGTSKKSRRREKADAIRATQNLRSSAATGSSATSLSEGENSIFQFDLPNVAGRDVNMGDMFAGKFKLMLIVNVASKCGKTKRNYEQLQALYHKYRPQGLEVVAVPCDQFKHQEPASNPEIEQFVREEMRAEFPVLGKVEVNGPGASALFRHLRDRTMHGRAVKWNFAKFLVDRRGVPLLAYEPKMDPQMMEGQIKLLLAAAAAAVKEEDNTAE